MVRSIPLVTYLEKIEHVAICHRPSQKLPAPGRSGKASRTYWRSHVEDGKTVEGRLRLEPCRLTQGVAIRAQECSTKGGERLRGHRSYGEGEAVGTMERSQRGSQAHLPVSVLLLEYGIAQLGALQLWRRGLTDRAGAVANYPRALSLGSLRPLPGLFAAAGTRFGFDEELIAPLMITIGQGTGTACAESTRADRVNSSRESLPGLGPQYRPESPQ